MELSIEEHERFEGQAQYLYDMADAPSAKDKRGVGELRAERLGALVDGVEGVVMIPHKKVVIFWALPHACCDQGPPTSSVCKSYLAIGLIRWGSGPRRLHACRRFGSSQQG